MRPAPEERGQKGFKMGDDSLKILIETAIDLEKSLQNVTADLSKLREKLKTYQIKVLAGLDKFASAAQIKNDLAQVAKGKHQIKVIGQVDKATTKQNVDAALKKLKNAEIKIKGVLDGSETIEDIQKQLKAAPNVTTRADVSVDGAEQVDNLTQKMDGAGKSAANMAGQLYLARTALQALRRAAHEAIDMVQELDAAATNLAIVTNGKTSEMYDLLEQYNDLAGQLRATTTQVAGAAESWLRQGKSTAETASLIEQSMILSKVAMMSSEDATKRLTSALNGYKLAAQDASAVVDKLAALDSKAAVTAGALAVAMSQTASSANIGGVSMDRLLGYLTTVQEVTQRSAETIGQSFKTVFARIGNIKLGNFLDDDGEDLSDVETILKNYGISLRNIEGDFRNFGTVLDELSAKWENFGAVDKRAIAQAFAGTRQQENFLVLMENYGKALEYAGISADSAGIALQKFSAYQDSIEAKSARFTAAVEGLTLDTVDAGFVGDLIDAGTAIIELVEGTHLLKAALLGLGAGATLKGVTAISDGFTAAKQNILSLGEAVQTLRNIQNVEAISGETINRLGALTKGLNNEQVKLVLTTQQLSSAQQMQILMAGGLSKAEATAKLQTFGLAAAEGTASAATVTFSGAMTGLGTALRAAFASNPIGMVMLAVGVVYELAQGIMAIHDACTTTAEEARETADELHSTFEETVSELENVNSELETSRTRLKELQALSDAGTITLVEQEELNNLQEEIELLERRKAILDEQRKNEGKDADAALVAAFEKQRFDPNDKDYFAAEMASLLDERKKLLSDIENGWNDAAQQRLDEIKTRMMELNGILYGEDLVMTSSSALGYEDYINRLIDTYQMLDKIAPADMSDSTLAIFESTRKKLVEAASILQEDWIDKLEVDEETKASWQALFDAIDRCINPAEHFTKALNDLSDAPKVQLEKLGESGELTAKQVEELAEKFPELKTWMEKSGYTAEETASHFNALSVSSSDAAQKQEEAVATLTETLDTLNTVSGNIGSISNALGEFQEEGRVSVDTLSRLSDELKNLSPFEDFVNVLSDSASTMEEVQSACNQLAKEYIDTTGILDNVNESNARLIEAQLKEIGVTNAHEIVQAKLNAARLDGILAANGQADAEWKVAEKTLLSSGAASSAVASFKQLRQEQYNAALAAQDLISASTSSITALLNQAKAAGVAAESIAGLGKALKLKEDYAAGRLKGMTLSEYRDMMNSYSKQAQADISGISVTVPTVNVSAPKSSSSKSSSKEVEEYIADIDKYRDAVERLRKAREEKGQIDHSLNNSEDLREQILLEKQLINAYQSESSALQALNQLRSGTINENADSLRKLGFEVQYNADTNELWIANLEHLNDLTARSKGKYGSLQEATNALRKETEELIDATTSLNEENRDGADSIYELGVSVHDAKSQIVDDLKEIVSQASGAVDEIQNVYDTLKAAAEEYEQNGGYISIDAYQDIVALGSQYMQYLKNENNLLVINEESINRVIEAKTRQLAAEQALAYVERLRGALQDGNIENLNTLLYATTEATDATFGLAYAELELMHQLGELDDTQYQAATHNIEAIRSLCETAVSSIGKVSGAAQKAVEESRKQLESLRDELEDMQAAGDDIIKYVMDMLKHRIQQQIDALEELKDAYGEIIDLRKEALDTAKKDVEYEDKVAAKVKQIAKLQERISALSLDNSRDAQAKRIRLEEELAGVQKELADDQSDHAVDAQKTALDKMKEENAKEKDAEIAVLKKTISSYQKLYDMAIDYISKHWDTLYSELIDWNTEYGSVLNSEITSSWDKCLTAAQRYGSFVDAMLGGIKSEIASINTQIESLNIGNYDYGAGSSSGNVVGKGDINKPSSDNEKVHAIIKRMYANMTEHGGSGSSTSAARKAQLSQENLNLGQQLHQYGINAYPNGAVLAKRNF